jgi:hypothetical protein
MEEKKVKITFFMPPEASASGNGVGASFILCYKDPKNLMEYLNYERKMLSFIPENNHGFMIIPILDEEDCYKYKQKYLGPGGWLDD